MKAKSGRGFTLIELLVVVAIAGILGALALPRFEHAQHRARTAEVDYILGHSKEIQLSWFGTHDCFVELRETPEGPNLPGWTKEPWISTRTPGADPCRDAHGYADTDRKSVV